MKTRVNGSALSRILFKANHSDIVRNALFFALSNEKRAASSEWINAVLLGVNFAFRAGSARFYLDKFIIAGPERELIYHVLRFGDVNGWMPRTLWPFVAEIKRNFRRAVACIGDEKQFLSQLRFEIRAHFFDRSGRAFPAAHPVAWIASLQLITGGT